MTRRSMLPRMAAWLLGLALSIRVGPVSAQPANDPGSAPLNIEIVLDASGSMAEPLATGETRMEAAKRILRGVVEAIPEEEGVNVGFRVFGHEGDNSEATRELSCGASRLLVAVDGVQKDRLLTAIDGAEPTGWTPIALSLRRAADDFPDAADAVVNAVVLVTDGTETCGGNPCAAARQLHRRAGLRLVTHVIGFATAPPDQARLACIAKNGGGRLLGAGDALELRDALFSVLEELGRGPAAGPTVGLRDIPGTEEAAIRTFAAAEFRAEGTIFLSFAVVRFTDEAAARAGMVEIRDRVVKQFARQSDVSALASVRPEVPGAEVLALAGDIVPTDPDDPDAIAIAILVAREGSLVHAMLGAALTGDPLADVVAVARRVVGRQPGEGPEDDPGPRTGGLWDALPRLPDLPAGFVLAEEFVPQL